MKPGTPKRSGRHVNKSKKSKSQVVRLSERLREREEKIQDLQAKLQVEAYKAEQAEKRLAVEIAVLRMELEKCRSANGCLNEQLEYARVKIASLTGDA